jgi:ribosomal protein S18 acetylase RimI-like enzyme
MPRLTDLARIGALLDHDRAWAAYAIGDLTPALADRCTWFSPADEAPALLLLYRGFDPPIAFAMGDPAHLAPLFAELDAPELSLHVRSNALAAMQPAYRPVRTHAMWRMAVEPAAFRPVPATHVEPLNESDIDAVAALYEDGHRHGEGPTFFHPSMLSQGTFRAMREGSALVAVAGTHLCSPELGVCAVGNVYTRRDRRRRGLAARVTSAVVCDALAQGITTIVLNVSQDNAGARRVYEQLGFICHCAFLEGEAVASLPRLLLQSESSGADNA